jgi:hypothetical protein
VVQDHRSQGVDQGNAVWKTSLSGYREDRKGECVPKGRDLRFAARIEGINPDVTGVRL